MENNLKTLNAILSEMASTEWVMTNPQQIISSIFISSERILRTDSYLKKQLDDLNRILTKEIEKTVADIKDSKPEFKDFKDFSHFEFESNPNDGIIQINHVINLPSVDSVDSYNDISIYINFYVTNKPEVFDKKEIRIEIKHNFDDNVILRGLKSGTTERKSKVRNTPLWYMYKTKEYDIKGRLWDIANRISVIIASEIEEKTALKYKTLSDWSLVLPYYAGAKITRYDD